jgi:hypothetical protein
MTPHALTASLMTSPKSRQLHYLATAATRPNISVRILPLRAPHPVSAESFVIFSFGPTGDAILHDVVASEGLKESFYIEDRQQAYLHLLGLVILCATELKESL